MFFSNDLLSKGRSGNPLAIVWVAATLGPRSNTKKLSKKDVMTVNVAKTCEYLCAPPEPLALRLISNLLVGVARVLNAQYTFYLADINSLILHLKRAPINSAQSTNMLAPLANIDAITMTLPPSNQLPNEGLLLTSDINDFRNMSNLTSPSKILNIDLSSIASPLNLHQTSPAVSSSTHSRATMLKSYVLSSSDIDMFSAVPGDNDIGDIGFDDDLLLGLNSVTSDKADIQKLGSATDYNWVPEHDYVAPNIETLDNEMNIEAQDEKIQRQTAKSSHKRKKLAVLDVETEISHDEFLAMRNNTADIVIGEKQIIIQRMKDGMHAISDHLSKPMTELPQNLLQFYHGNTGFDLHSAMIETPPPKRVKRKSKTERESIQLPSEDIDDVERLRAAENSVPRFESPMTPWSGAGSSSAGRSMNDPFYNSNIDFPFEEPEISLRRQSFEHEFSPLGDLAEIEEPLFHDDDSFENAEQISLNEKDTLAFFNYAKNIMRTAGTNYAYFMDLLQTETCSRKVACQAFHHLLVLSNRGNIKPSQKEAYGDIRMELINF